MKEQILKLAQHQMMAGGYDFLNFATIAQELKTTRANLHYHYKNKESLALAVAEIYVIEKEADVAKLVSIHKDDFLKLACAFEDYVWEKAEETGSCSCVCSQILRNPTSPKSLFELSQGHFFRMTEMIQKVAKESIKSENLKSSVKPEFISREFAAIISGMSLFSTMFSNLTESKKHFGGIVKEWVKNYRP